MSKVKECSWIDSQVLQVLGQLDHSRLRWMVSSEQRDDIRMGLSLWEVTAHGAKHPSCRSHVFEQHFGGAASASCHQRTS